MSRIFDIEMEDLDDQFRSMGKMVARTIDKSVVAFMAHDTKAADEIINRDHEINERESAIEKKTFEMIALYQPVTTDLREVVTILKAVSVLERMGDYARDIAQSTIRIHHRQNGDRRMPAIERKISEMGLMATRTVDEILDAYVSDSIDDAQKVATHSQHVGQLSSTIRKDILASMKDDADTVDTGADYLVVVGYLKRTADHATDIAEWLVYKRSGKIVELNPGSSSFI
ncbi:phosphate signaling complex protein PhoU [Oenococcus kitaharae]|uniref:Phosphate-specific transport system accessory protein PhoU n=1 Tax=Oenococcus kitaharae DSM 17330 TaxID=1045004 RepID=G9WFE5_9LACO|nr:phosphate signaling complex protein PhoU [Oenococcus kitaharae]EHN59102.1 Phosphate transport system regulatory protein [Oenococcus kitaharae DSM 17330]MCV3297026.1 phosphate signaling complex protein PhoU [Oenococcus kitaharae]OEY82015.1 PhoU family transcriptional regulator [Oenococcus kitaharae]OEY82386.1 PhoU family transcriptional regulator [Oenococcus kitaharae]OEY82792.1 PhoU family transcriptional regulator [Oenococcus kitaharae]